MSLFFWRPFKAHKRGPPPSQTTGLPFTNHKEKGPWTNHVELLTDKWKLTFLGGQPFVKSRTTERQKDRRKETKKQVVVLLVSPEKKKTKKKQHKGDPLKNDILKSTWNPTWVQEFLLKHRKSYPQKKRPPPEKMLPDREQSPVRFAPSCPTTRKAPGHKEGCARRVALQ